MTTRRRCFGSVPVTTSTASLRPFMTVSFDFRVWGISCWRRSGGVRGLYPRTEGVNVRYMPQIVFQLGFLTAPIFRVFFVPHIGVLDVVALRMSQSCPMGQLKVRT